MSFNRSPNWITPEFSQSLAKDGRNTVFTPEEIERFNKDKKYFLDYRKKVQNTGSGTYGLYYMESDMQKEIMQKCTEIMRTRLKGNEDLCAKLIPNFHVGCRRYFRF